MNKNITIVTGLWDMGRGNLDGWAKRDFEQYKSRFFEMLEADAQMCVWVPKELEPDVIRIRKNKPTKIFIKNLEDFKTWNPFFDKIQQIRNNPEWRNFAGWLSESPQANLEFYNAMMFTKMFMLNDSAFINPFESEYFFWIDGGLTNTVHSGYFLHDNVLDNLQNFVVTKDNKFIFLSYPYEGNNEIHGFERTAMAKYCSTDFVKYVCRGGFFGGKKSVIHDINGYYYSIMNNTLNEGLMGADECLFTILAHTHTDIVHRFEIDGNGLVWPFFEELKNYKIDQLKHDKKIKNAKEAALYVITYNSPKQFKTLIESMLDYDKNFIEKPTKYLLDNSSKPETFEQYSELCKKYNFEHIKKDNLGICGGRQFIAEHFDQSDAEYMYFFEDDMFFCPKKDQLCKSGFARFVADLYRKSLRIIQEEELDFLKLSFSEFYGTNSTQWSWYNVPQHVREEIWPDYSKLPEHGTDPNSPKTKFQHIKTHEGVSYATGEVYYCNWPQVVSKEGSKKMFLTTTWGHPFEQTWMSYIFQETRKGNIKPGLLLLSPTEHNRFDHYPASERKES